MKKKIYNIIIFSFILISLSCTKKINIKDYTWVLLSETKRYNTKQISRIIIDTLDVDKIQSLKHINIFMYEKTEKFDLKDLIQVLEQSNSIETLALINVDTIPSNITKLTNLKALHIGGRSQIYKLPEDIDKLKNLEYLDLGTPTGHLNFRKNINVLPLNLFKLEKLKRLSLCSNPITYLPKEVCNLDSLYFLDLRGTNIDSLPHCICNRSNIKTIKINHDFDYKALPCEEKFIQKGIPFDSIEIKQRKPISKFKKKYVKFSIWFIEHIKWPLGF